MSYFLNADEFNFYADALEKGMTFGPYSKHTEAMKRVKHILERGIAFHVCSLHGVEMTEYKPGYIRCDVCHNKQGETE